MVAVRKVLMLVTSPLPAACLNYQKMAEHIARHSQGLPHSSVILRSLILPGLLPRPVTN